MFSSVRQAKISLQLWRAQNHFRLLFVLLSQRCLLEVDVNLVLSVQGTSGSFYCLDPSHLISECKAWKQKSVSKPKNVALVQSVPELNVLDAVYQPFLSFGSVSLSPDSETQQVRILRDTGAMQSLI